MSNLERPTTTPHVLRAEPIQAERFAPFGTMLTAASCERLNADFYGEGVSIHRVPVDSDYPVELLLNCVRRRPLRVAFVERHVGIEQAFIPVGGIPYLVVLARPDARQEQGMPALSELCAFTVPGDVAIKLHRGTWHEFPFPLADEGRFLVTSHRQLSQSLEVRPDAQQDFVSEDLEKRSIASRLGAALSIELG